MEIETEIRYAEIGFDLWKSLEDRYKLSEHDCVICFPTNHEQLNNVAISHVGRFVKGKYYSRAILVLRDDFVIPESVTREQTVIEKEYLTEDSMIALTYFFRLMNIRNNVIVISAEEPFGNLNLVGKYGIDYEEYVSGTYI